MVIAICVRNTFQGLCAMLLDGVFLACARQCKAPQTYIALLSEHNRGCYRERGSCSLNKGLTCRVPWNAVHFNYLCHRWTISVSWVTPSATSDSTSEFLEKLCPIPSLLHFSVWQVYTEWKNYSRGDVRACKGNWGQLGRTTNPTGCIGTTGRGKKQPTSFLRKQTF